MKHYIQVWYKTLIEYDLHASVGFSFCLTAFAVLEALFGGQSAHWLPSCHDFGIADIKLVIRELKCLNLLKQLFK